MIVRDLFDIESTEVADAAGVTRKLLLARQETPNFEMRLFTIQPGGSMPGHTNQVEHEQFVISGKGRVGISGEEFDVRFGHVLLIPADAPHWYRNTGTEVFQFICLVPNQQDKITYV